MTPQIRQEAFSFLVETIARGELTTDELRSQWEQIFEGIIFDIMNECEIDLDDQDAFNKLATQYQAMILKNAQVRREYLEQQAAA
jgi:hypothetical protein